ncbi:MAG: glycosyltransferase family 39 protein [Actinomycetota bacterium]|nr:glycosyltransferase family 39 protein [Actinomycetota bacterium]
MTASVRDPSRSGLTARRFSPRTLFRAGPPFGVPEATQLRSLTVAELGLIVLAGGIAVLGTVGLIAAQIGIFGWPSLISGTVVVGIGLLAVVARLRIPKIVLDPIGLITALAVVALAAFMFFPGFHFGTGDRDPGVYMETGAAIARTGSLTIPSGVAGTAGLPVQPFSLGVLWPGLWDSGNGTGSIVPQFYHFWTALLGAAFLVRGFGAESNLTPLIGVLAVVVAVLIARRVGGPVAAVFTGALLPTMMMQVWQAKYPSSEMIAQLLFLAGVLCLLIAVQAASSAAALLAGIFAGVGYLARADGILLIIIAACCLAVLWLLRRCDRRAGWFLVGLVPVTAYGAYQGYVWAKAYTDSNLPSGSLIFGGIFVVVMLSLSLRPLVPRLADRINEWADSHRTQYWLAMAAIVGSAAFFLWAVWRPNGGQDLINYNGVMIRSYDEESLYWLSWFFTWPALVLVIVGIAVLLLTRWSSTSGLIVVPVVLLLPLYLWHVRNSPYLMWWGRRFVPTLVPGMIILIAVALAAVWSTRSTWIAWAARLLTIAGVVAIAWVYVGQSAPLRHHDEMAGSYNVTANMAALAGGQQGVFLWDSSGPCCGQPSLLFGGPLLMYDGEVSVSLPTDVPAIGAYVAAYAKRFPDRPLFVVFQGGTLSPQVRAQLADFTVTAVQRVQTSMPIWEQSAVHRPDHATGIAVDITVYRLTHR